MNIDLHSHVIPPTIVAAIRRDPQRFGMKIAERDGKLHFERRGKMSELDPQFHDVDAKIEAMDRMRLDVSALSVAPPTYFYALAPEAGLAASRLSNDGIAQMVARYPHRLRGMATLPMQDPDAAIVELERVVIGTDNPFNMGYDDPLAALDAIPGLTSAEREQICGLTALELLGEH